MEREPGNSEVSFEEGVEKTMLRLEELTQSETGPIVVCINGSSANVGKSHLARGLSEKIRAKGWAYVRKTGLDYDSLNEKRVMEHDLERAKMDRPGQPVVIIFEGFGMDLPNLETEADVKNIILLRFSEGTNLQLSKVHLWVAIYSPDRPFRRGKSDPLGEIVIRNEAALEKKLK